MGALRLLTLIVSGLAVLALTLPAHAQDPQQRARALGKEGGAAGRAGDYVKAIELFKRARAIDDRAEYQCSIGVAYFALKRFPRAQLYFSQCFARSSAIDAGKLDKVRAVYAAVQKALREGEFAPVEILAEPVGALVQMSHFVDNASKGGVLPTPASVWLPFGDHTVTVTATGYQTKSVKLSLSRRARYPVKVTLDRIPAPVSSVGAAASAQATSSEPLAGEMSGGVRPARGQSFAAAWISLSVATIAVAGAATFHVYARGSRADLAGLVLSEPRDEIEATFDRQRAAAIGLYAVGAVAAGLGSYLWLRSSSERIVAVGAAAAPTGGTLWVRWTR